MAKGGGIINFRDIEFPEPFDEQAQVAKKKFSCISVAVLEEWRDKQNTTGHFKPVDAGILFVGESGVGKTRLINKLVYGRIGEQSFHPSLGVTPCVRSFMVGGVPFRLLFMDAAASVECDAVKQYLHKIYSIVFVFDMTDLSSLRKLPQLQEVLMPVDRKFSYEFWPECFVIGTRKDRIEGHEYNALKERATNVAREMKAELWLVASRDDDNQENWILSQLYKRIAYLTINRGIDLGKLRHPDMVCDGDEDETSCFRVNLGNLRGWLSPSRIRQWTP